MTLIHTQQKNITITQGNVEEATLWRGVSSQHGSPHSSRHHGCNSATPVDYRSPCRAISKTLRSDPVKTKLLLQ